MNGFNFFKSNRLALAIFVALSSGSGMSNVSAAVGAVTCEECETEPAVLCCGDCMGSKYCKRCSIDIHADARRSGHTKTYLEGCSTPEAKRLKTFADEVYGAKRDRDDDGNSAIEDAAYAGGVPSAKRGRVAAQEEAAEQWQAKVEAEFEKRLAAQSVKAQEALKAMLEEMQEVLAQDKASRDAVLKQARATGKHAVASDVADEEIADLKEQLAALAEKAKAREAWEQGRMQAREDMMSEGVQGAQRLIDEMDNLYKAHDSIIALLKEVDAAKVGARAVLDGEADVCANEELEVLFKERMRMLADLQAFHKMTKSFVWSMRALHVEVDSSRLCIECEESSARDVLASKNSEEHEVVRQLDLIRCARLDALGKVEGKRREEINLEQARAYCVLTKDELIGEMNCVLCQANAESEKRVDEVEAAREQLEENWAAAKAKADDRNNSFACYAAQLIDESFRESGLPPSRRGEIVRMDVMVSLLQKCSKLAFDGDLEDSKREFDAEARKIIRSVKEKDKKQQVVGEVTKMIFDKACGRGFDIANFDDVKALQEAITKAFENPGLRDCSSENICAIFGETIIEDAYTIKTRDSLRMQQEEAAKKSWWQSWGVNKRKR
jgi:hypothetical protein